MAVRRSSSLLIAEERESSCICRSSSNWLTASVPAAAGEQDAAVAASGGDHRVMSLSQAPNWKAAMRASATVYQSSDRLRLWILVESSFATRISASSVSLRRRIISTSHAPSLPCAFITSFASDTVARGLSSAIAPPSGIAASAGRESISPRGRAGAGKVCVLRRGSAAGLRKAPEDDLGAGQQLVALLARTDWS